MRHQRQVTCLQLHRGRVQCRFAKKSSRGQIDCLTPVSIPAYHDGLEVQAAAVVYSRANREGQAVGSFTDRSTFACLARRRFGEIFKEGLLDNLVKPIVLWMPARTGLPVENFAGKGDEMLPRHPVRSRRQ